MPKWHHLRVCSELPPLGQGFLKSVFHRKHPGKYENVVTVLGGERDVNSFKS